MRGDASAGGCERGGTRARRSAALALPAGENRSRPRVEASSHPGGRRRTGGFSAPHPQNVALHASRQSAESPGFRPCQRCRPDLPPRVEREAAIVVRLCQRIDECPEEPRLEELAAHIGASASTTHRLFKKVMGITPKAYAAAHRAERVRGDLAAASGSITSAI